MIVRPLLMSRVYAPAFCAFNPACTVPVLELNDLAAICEAAVIWRNFILIPV
ncbi:hypothetical protein ASAP_2207 [Asaia bogorensis]|uniref:Uncharacterized protein n=1 Tax=Asaia bogorensis TaxID=91915 RepID=A0A060QLD8_9PROT|nr:hypothetical protein P792_15890 [Asaia sp. SF2.1]CDG40252.1 hypothetical protein ASAP_2207 [Asaia bogorensis]